MRRYEWEIWLILVTAFACWLLLGTFWPAPEPVVTETPPRVEKPVRVEHPTEQTTSLVPVGTYKVTHYEPWVTGTNRTASGRTATDGVDLWVAAHPEDFPIGTVLLIDGYGVRTVEDTGVPRGTIDVLVSDYDTAMSRGVVRDVQVWRIEYDTR